MRHFANSPIKRSEEDMRRNAELLELKPISYAEGVNLARRRMFGDNFIEPASDTELAALRYGERHPDYSAESDRHHRREAQIEQAERWVVRAVIYDRQGTRYVSAARMEAALSADGYGAVVESGKAAGNAAGIDNEPEPIRTPSAAVEPDRTGLPGRPTSWHLIEAEFLRRSNAGERHPTTAEWATVLLDWFAVNHQAAAKPTRKTLTNNLAPLIRRLKAQQPETAPEIK
jgi:hypothetical protein